MYDLYGQLVFDSTKRQAIVFDLDGTLALRGDRHPHDLLRVSEDQPNPPVVWLARTIMAAGMWVIVTTGRQHSCYDDTARWLEYWLATPDFGLKMRVTGDNRPDDVVKQEMHDAIATQYKILMVFDDRNKVVDMWRRNRVTCLQVAPGDF